MGRIYKKVLSFHSRVSRQESLRIFQLFILILSLFLAMMRKTYLHIHFYLETPVAYCIYVCYYIHISYIMYTKIIHTYVQGICA